MKSLPNLFLLTSLLAPLLTAQVPQFTDVTPAALSKFRHINGPPEGKKYLFEAKGGGLAFLDFDNDGWLDIFVVQGSTVERMRAGENPHSRLYRNHRNGDFHDVTEQSGITSSGWGMGVACGDYDNDGFVDIYVTQLGANILYRNNGDGTFSDRSGEAGVNCPRWSASAAFGDYDQDGDLDLYVANYVSMDLAYLPEPGSESFCQYRGRPDLCGPMGLRAEPNVLYRNRGDGTFEDVTEASGVGENNRFYSLSAVWADLDGDGDADLLVGNDSTPNNLFVNHGNGRFEDVGILSGLAASGDGGFQASMGIDTADFDNDALLDVFMTHFANDYCTLYSNRGGLLFEDISAKAHLIQPAWLKVSWGTRFADFDLDGWKDLFHSNGHVYPFLITAGWSEEYQQGSSLYLNNRDGTFRDVSADAGSALSQPMVGRGAAFGDYDNDGDLDILLANLNGSPVLLRNDYDGPGHWIQFLVQGSPGNRDALGARITVEAGGVSQIWEVKRTVGIYSSSDPRAHFGLGTSSRAARVTVAWPGGGVQRFTDLSADQHYLIDQRRGLDVWAPR